MRQERESCIFTYCKPIGKKVQRRLPPTSSLNIFMCVSHTVLLLYKMLKAHMPNAQFHSGQNQNDVCSHSYTHRHSKWQIQNPSQHYCVPPKVMKTVPTLLIYLVQNATLLQTWAFKKVFTKKSLFYAFHPDFSHRGTSQVEQLNSYNSPGPVLLSGKNPNSTFV